MVVGDRFTVEREAGSGGMATVYAATDKLTGARVALKIIARASAVESERFMREAEALATTDHPAIVRYVAHGAAASGQLYLAMEWLEGEDLSARLVRHGLTVGESVSVTRHVADALAALHRRGIVHRDVKPSNVFLVDGEVDRVKLVDLGIARTASAAATLTRAGSLVGTPGYMAPEQARGVSKVTARADVFALGCVLFECLTGAPAFQGENVMALLAKILLADAPRVREVRPDVPRALDDLCASMLRKEPLERPDALAVVEALAGIEASDAPAPRGSGARVRTPALTSSEQRLVCLLLATPTSPSADARDSMAPTMSSDAMSQELTAVASRVASVGVRVDRLVDGTLLGIAHRDADAPTQAMATARAALLLRAEMPGAAIAVATGRGDVSTPLPVGEVIDRAAKLHRASRHATGHPIVVDEVTAALLGEAFEVTRAGGANVLVTERSEARTGARTLLGKETPFVGRDRELALLEGLVAECISESAARAVVVTAAAGVGKSRLRRELVSRAMRDFPELVVWTGRGDPLQTGSPFALLGRALRDAAGIAEAETSDERVAKVSRRLDALNVPERERVAAFASELVGARARSDRVDVAAARTDPQLMNDQLRGAWLAWLDAETRSHPVMLVLEDLQWGDAPTVSFVDEALRAFAERPWFVLAVARPEVERVFPRLWAERGVQPLPLRELSRRAAETLARHVLGPAAQPALVEGVVSRAMGNAFFLEELIRASAERGNAVALPETVLAVVEARLDTLDPDGRRILRAASIFGETFHAGGVAALLGDDAKAIDLPGWLELLVRKESVVARPTSSIQGESELVFRHALVREAAYAMLTEKDRTLGHRLAGAWLESKGVRDAALLAEHYERGGERARAATFFAQAARERLAGQDVAGTLSAIERGLSCAGDPETRAALLVLHAEARQWLGEFEIAERDACEAMALAQAEAPLWWSAVENALEAASRLNHVGVLESLIANIERRGAASAEAFRAIAAAAIALVDLGRYEVAKRLLGGLRDEVVAARPLAAARLSEARARLGLAFGDIDLFCTEMSSAEAAYEQAGARRHAALRSGSVAYGALLLGRYEEAVARFTTAAERARAAGALGGVLTAKHNLGLALLRTGKVRESIEVESEALALAREQKNPRLAGACLYYLSLAHHAAGALDGAEAHALESVAVCEGIPPSRAEALGALAQARLAKGNVTQALADAAEAMHILREVGGIDEGEPFIRLMHAETLWATGAQAEARAAIAEARAHLDARAARIGDPRSRETFLAAWENARILARAREWA